MLGLKVGIAASVLRGTWVDRAIVAGMSGLAAIPSFVGASMLIAIFAVQLRMFPSFCSGTGFWGGVRARITGLLEPVGLEARHVNVAPRRRSGGQRPRVTIAKAMAVDPRLLVLDEATSALDVSVQAQVIALINQLRKERGVAVMFISHDLAIVGGICEELIGVRSGAVVKRGATTEVLASPRHPHTQALAAAVPKPRWETGMNSSDGGGRLRVSSEQGERLELAADASLRRIGGQW